MKKCLDVNPVKDQMLNKFWSALRSSNEYLNMKLIQSVPKSNIENYKETIFKSRFFRVEDVSQLVSSRGYS
ncbi:3558_t:CDS:2 [Entrophospora sp. SA101]|nr:3558_t:CDS:2 [Entrophospora sp. SA101]CAJ0907471.1 3834_t:CDS:2 [Entrophospora sp. SA101]